ncbi:peptidase C15 [Calothrix sp. 336/3]|uniref:peptidase C15 n=1 Tax=Calothrix sp. 336/3 TaxID=1337936 RepID=UPI0004E3F142|nr:peptidase C15 [Calothrix sp. 336/3]AKG24270.1 peptidase C15 [Calothrix sp. 336/3]
MSKRFLLTSFDIWLPHHQSNSSDDLLTQVSKLEGISHDLTCLRLLPVDIALASSQVIEKIRELQPQAIICCGMAEKRSQLTVESNASCGEAVLQTTVDLQNLLALSENVGISHDCGKFICEGLYYSVLDYLNRQQIKVPCIFVHVPILTEDNLSEITRDFLLIIHQLALS